MTCFKLEPDDIDFIVVDEAHIAAADSYQRTFRHFAGAAPSSCRRVSTPRRTPIDADVVYRYRLIDSIADGNAKNLRVSSVRARRDQTTYEIVWPDGGREEIVGRDAILDILGTSGKLARITAKSHEPIRQVMREVRSRSTGRRSSCTRSSRGPFAALGRASRRADRRGSPTSTESQAHTCTTR